MTRGEVRGSRLAGRRALQGRQARRQASAHRNGLAEGVVQVAVDQAGLTHAGLTCAAEDRGGFEDARQRQSARAAGCRCCEARAAPPAPQACRARAALAPGARGATYQGAQASGRPFPSLAALWTHRLCECDLVAPAQMVQGDEECGLVCGGHIWGLVARQLLQTEMHGCIF